MSTHSETYPVSSYDRGIKLLEIPAQNKGTAFTDAERAAFGLEGLLPSSVETIDQQQRRILQQLGQKPTDLERYIFLIQLSDSNQTLFYHVVMSDPAYFLPILYCYSHLHQSDYSVGNSDGSIICNVPHSIAQIQLIPDCGTSNSAGGKSLNYV